MRVDTKQTRENTYASHIVTRGHSYRHVAIRTLSHSPMHCSFCFFVSCFACEQFATCFVCLHICRCCITVHYWKLARLCRAAPMHVVVCESLGNALPLAGACPEHDWTLNQSIIINQPATKAYTTERTQRTGWCRRWGCLLEQCLPASWIAYGLLVCMLIVTAMGALRFAGQR